MRDAWSSGARDKPRENSSTWKMLPERSSWPDPAPMNLGSGYEISIGDLVDLIVRHIDYKGEIVWDISKPDGQPRRGLDTSRAERTIGFRAAVPFEEGLGRTIAWYEYCRRTGPHPTTPHDERLSAARKDDLESHGFERSASLLLRTGVRKLCDHSV